MRDLRLLEAYRVSIPGMGHAFGSPGCAEGGAFRFFHVPTVTEIHVIASAGEGWDHVSVSTQKRTPTWDEMEFVKRSFFKEDETAWEYHVAEKDHINGHPHCLHIWRKHDFDMPMPPKVFV